jgi:hypothetical protein
MAVERELQQFVHDALGRGQSRTQIEQVLAGAGWRAEQVARALSEYADVPFPVPVPRPRPYLSAREAFLYLVLFTTLYVSAISLGGMLFAFIERALPDAAERANSAQQFRDSVRWWLSNLLVAFPVFVLLSISMQRAIRRDPTRRASRIRKWLTYVTLYVGAAVLIGDVIALIHGLLGGDLTTRFVLKALVVGAIAGTAFGYYLYDLRQDENEAEA